MQATHTLLKIFFFYFYWWNFTPYNFKEGEESTAYVYNHIREDENVLYGFTTEDERELFLKLISVKGLGPKMAMPILATGSINGIVDADRKSVV